MNGNGKSKDIQMDFSKSRMALLRVIYFLVALGFIFVAKVQFGLSNSVFFFLVIGALVIVVISYPLQMKLVYTVAYNEKRVGAGSMIGLQGEALEDLNPDGRVKVRGEIWKARAESGDIGKGNEIMVRSVEDGLRLLVTQSGDQW